MGLMLAIYIGLSLHSQPTGVYAYPHIIYGQDWAHPNQILAHVIFASEVHRNGPCFLSSIHRISDWTLHGKYD